MRLRFYLAAASLALSAGALAQTNAAPTKAGVANPEIWPAYEYPVPHNAATEARR